MLLFSGNPRTVNRTVNNKKRKCSPSLSPWCLSPAGPSGDSLSGDSHKQAMNTPFKVAASAPRVSSHPPAASPPSSAQTPCAPALNPRGERADCHYSVKAAWVGRGQWGQGWKRRLCPETRTPHSDSQLGLSFGALGKLHNLSDFFSCQTE